jgi:tRNA A-37 threonylcarbamoyl transferase component Bud32
MAHVEINPRYRDFLQRHGVHSADGFLGLPGMVICGHPDRHVARVRIGNGNDSVSAFIKREHRILWRNRLANVWAGFGPISQSRREARQLGALRCAGVGCPEWIAAGEDDQGRAFVLVRELTDARELCEFLRSEEGRLPTERRRLARALGEALAQMHEMGFDHPDLYCKHVLYDAAQGAVHIVDWQRSRRRGFLAWPRRWRDLGALHATLADHLAAPRDRLACLRAYLRAAVPFSVPREFRRTAVRAIVRHAGRLLRHRHIRELREPPVRGETPAVFWLDGEALCVTPQAHAAWNGRPPGWLWAASRFPGQGSAVERTSVAAPGAAESLLVRRRSRWSLRALWGWLTGRAPIAPEVRQAGLLFRLQRYGIATPRLLAFGQRHCPPHRTESFLLTESAADAVGVERWWSVPQARHRLLKKIGALLRRIHEAGCCFGAGTAFRNLLVDRRADGAPVLGSMDGLVRAGRRRRTRTRRDLAMFLHELGSFSRTDRLRFVLGYAGASGPALARRFASLILRRSRA